MHCNGIIDLDTLPTLILLSLFQCARQSYTQKVDIYALGMIFFELFYPFSTQMERIKTLMEIKKLNFPHRFEKELPKEVSAHSSIIWNCLPANLSDCVYHDG